MTAAGLAPAGLPRSAPALSAEEWHEVARRRFQEQAYDAARDALLRAQALYPDDGVDRVSGFLGWIASAQGDHRAAVRHFRKQERCFGNYLSALNLAEACRKAGDEERHRRYADVAMKRSYTLRRTTWEKTRTLYVLLSPVPGRLILRKHRLPGTALYVVDESSTYYTLNADHIAARLLALVEKEAFERVVMIGHSKGGFGALLVGALLAGSSPQAAVRVLALSPQIRLLPHNDNLDVVPSYCALLNWAKSNMHVRAALEKYGDASAWCARSPALEALLVYGRYYECDAVEAGFMSAPNVRKRAIEYSGHNTLMCCSIPPGLGQEAIVEKYKSLMDANEDLAALEVLGAEFLAGEMAALSASGECTIDRFLSELA